MEAREVIKWLNICSKDNAGEHCNDCPYNQGAYEDGCGKLLADAALLLSAVYPQIAHSELKIGPDGLCASVSYDH